MLVELLRKFSVINTNFENKIILIMRKNLGNAQAGQSWLNIQVWCLIAAARGTINPIFIDPHRPHY